MQEVLSRAKSHGASQESAARRHRLDGRSKKIWQRSRGGWDIHTSSEQFVEVWQSLQRSNCVWNVVGIIGLSVCLVQIVGLAVSCQTTTKILADRSCLQNPGHWKVGNNLQSVEEGAVQSVHSLSGGLILQRSNIGCDCIPHLCKLGQQHLSLLFRQISMMLLVQRLRRSGPHTEDCRFNKELTGVGAAAGLHAP